MKQNHDAKYRGIITLSSLDGIFALGLIKRIYDLPHSFKFRVRRARKNILLGIPIAIDAEINQCFIIDNIHCLSSIKHSGSNITLCDEKYGSVTDIVVDIFGLDLPDKYLDAVFDVTIGNISSEISKQMYIALLLSDIHERNRLVDWVKDSDWSKVDKWITTKTRSDLYRIVIERSNSFLLKAKRITSGAYALKFQVSNFVDRISIRPSLLYLKETSKVSIGIGVDKDNVVRCYLFSNKTLTRIGRVLEQRGFISITRKHGVSLLSVNLNYYEFLDILRDVIRKFL